MKEQLQKENSLITSAWFNIGTRIQGDHVFLQRQGPQSFLNQQRLILDTQVRFIFQRLIISTEFL
jgi:protein HOOK3